MGEKADSRGERRKAMCRAGRDNVLPLTAHQTGKRTANRYMISIKPEYRKKILQNFRGQGAAEFFRQHTSELWTPPFSELTAAQYGAFRRLLMMFARHKDTVKSGNILTTKKELKSFGISCHLLAQIRTKVNVLDISLISDDGAIKDLPWG